MIVNRIRALLDNTSAIPGSGESAGFWRDSDNNLKYTGSDSTVYYALNSSGSATSGQFNITNTLTASAYAASSHFDELYSKVTLTPTTTVTAANGLNAFRGEINITAGKTLGDGSASYVTAVYGRVNFNTATINIASGDLAAVYGKFDMGSTSTLTSGHIAPVQANIVNPPAGAAAAGVSLFYGESASGTPIGNGIELYMGAAYLMKLTQVSGGTFFGATAPTSLAKSLKVNVDGTDYYIGLYSNPS